MPGVGFAAALSLTLAPGFLMIRGYSRRRYRTKPERDVYAVAEAVVASAIWLGVAWLALLEFFGDPMENWGIVPLNTKRLGDHQSPVVLLGLGAILVPYVVGLGTALVANWLGDTHREPTRRRWLADKSLRLLRRVGFFRSPTAWDRAWLTFREHGSGEVVVRLRDGSIVRGAYGKYAQADLSPRPRQLFLETGYTPSDAEKGLGDPVAEEGDPATYGPLGVFIDGSDIATIYFKENDHDAPYG